MMVKSLPKRRPGHQLFREIQPEPNRRQLLILIWEELLEELDHNPHDEPAKEGCHPTVLLTT